MGTVWRAEDLRLRAPVAVKLIHRRDIDNAETLARFEAEAEIAAQLRSPHVVHVFDAGVDHGTGAPFIVMELLEGESLRDRLRRVRTIAPADLAHIVSQVARALTRAHALGIIHRDLKPANIFLLRDGNIDVVKVLDFGIAKRTHGSHAAATATGDLLGTPSYMSPEQIKSSKDVDYRADLWSLAVIATECLTGKLPFKCDTLPGLSYLICHGRAKLPSELGRVPKGFDRWFRKATQRAAADRFSSAAVMAENLLRVCEVGGVRLEDGQLESGGENPSVRGDRSVSPSIGPTTRPLPHPVDPWRRTERRTQRKRRAALGAGAALLLLGAGAVIGWLYLVGPSGPELAPTAASLEPSLPMVLPEPPEPGADQSSAAVEPEGSTGQPESSEDVNPVEHPGSMVHAESEAGGTKPVELAAPALVPPSKSPIPVRPAVTTSPASSHALEPSVTPHEDRLEAGF